MTATWQLHADAAPRLQPTAGGGAALALSRKDAALLAHVALAGAVPSARIAGWLWPADDARKSLNSLRQRLHRLRRATGARLLDVGDAATLAADLSLAGSGAASAGDLLGGFDYADAPDFALWLQAERLHWVAARREARARAASAAEQRGELAQALVCAQQLLSDDLLSEHAHRRVMRLHYLRGDSASAVAAFEACERTLKDELGLKPSAETLALLQTVEHGRAPAPAVLTPMPVSLLRPPRVVGRTHERAVLAQAQHDGHIAVLVGEGGMGKTRLLQDFIAARPQAVYAQARPGDASVPYGALARLVRAVVAAQPAVAEPPLRAELARFVPELAEGALSMAPATPRLQPAVERLLAAALAAGIDTLVVDDLHFADPASVEMLRALLDADDLASLRWVFAHRPAAAAGEDAVLLQTLADAPRARWIPLAPLTEGELAELLESLALAGVDAATLAPALARHTGGNPLYVLETLREARPPSGAGWALPQPQSIAHLIDRRLQRLSERALALGRVAALAGPDFSPELAGHALATPALLLAGAWAELEAADVLRGSAFAHDLVRDGMLRATPQAIAAHGHRMIAGWLADHGAEPARVALHWRQAGEPVRAAAAYRAAADLACAASRPREHARLLLDAADMFDAAGDTPAALRLRTRALLPTFYGVGLAEAQQLADALAQASAGGSLAGCVWARSASLFMHSGQVGRAEQAARRALELLGAGEADERAVASAALALAWQGQGRSLEGLELLQPWVDRLDTLSDVFLRVEICSAHAVLLYFLNRLDDAALALRRQLALIRSEPGVGEQAPPLISAAMLALRRGEAEEALQCASEVLRLRAGEREPDTITGAALLCVGEAACALGRYEPGLASIDSALAVLRVQAPGTKLLSSAESTQAEVLLQIGQTARAMQCLAGDGQALPPAARVQRLLVQAALARATGQAGDALLAQARELAVVGGGGHLLQRVDLELARQLDPDACLAAVETVWRQSLADGDRVLSLLAALTRLHAMTQRFIEREGAWQGAATELAAAAGDALQRLRTCRSTQVFHLQGLMRCRAAYAAAGRQDAAAQCLAEAGDWMRQVALAHLPHAYRDAFLNRHPVVAEFKRLSARPSGI